MNRNAGHSSACELRIQCEAARQIRQHARSSLKAEICGVLIGSEDGVSTVVQATIPGANAVEAGTHVTFTQDTWEHIYKIKDRDYPDARIVGWYHSHPGFGVFLSDHDTFIHENFFSSPRQVAWVYDPHSDEEGCFGWIDNKLSRLERIIFVDDKGGEAAGEAGKPEPLMLDQQDEGAPAGPESSHKGEDVLGLAGAFLKYFAVFLAGCLLCWYFFPRLLAVPVDPRTGQPLLSLQPIRSKDSGATTAPPTNAPATPAVAPQTVKGKQ
jgi:proteasome lid subunit RPN8/RPN11